MYIINFINLSRQLNWFCFMFKNSWKYRSMCWGDSSVCSPCHKCICTSVQRKFWEIYVYDDSSKLLLLYWKGTVYTFTQHTVKEVLFGVAEIKTKMEYIWTGTAGATTMSKYVVKRCKRKRSWTIWGLWTEEELEIHGLWGMTWWVACPATWGHGEVPANAATGSHV